MTNERDERFLRLACAAARRSREHGHHPFGAFLASRAVLWAVERAVEVEGPRRKTGPTLSSAEPELRVGQVFGKAC